VALLCGILFSVAVTVGVVLTIRRRTAVLDDVLLDRRRSVMVVAVLSLFGLAEALNGLPSRLYAYATAMPWSNWVGINVVVTGLAALVPALVALGLWITVSALRRRVGVPLLTADGPEGRRDVLLAGLGLGALVAVLRLLGSLSGRTGIPQGPSTALDQAVPFLGQALAIPMQVVIGVTVPAIVVLAVAGVSRRPVLRALVGTLVLAPLMVLSATMAPAGASPLLRAVGLGVTVLVAGSLALRLWAPCCAWAWIVAGVVDEGFTGLRGLVHAPTGVERAAGGVALGMAVVLLLVATRVVGPERISPHQSAGEAGS
jgi:hypothetical protein